MPAGVDSIDDRVTLLADPTGELVRGLGLVDNIRPGDGGFSALGSGVQAKRFALITRDGAVEHLALDEDGLGATSHEAILSKLAWMMNVKAAPPEDPASRFGGKFVNFFARAARRIMR